MEVWSRSSWYSPDFVLLSFCVGTIGSPKGNNVRRSIEYIRKVEQRDEPVAAVEQQAGVARKLRFFVVLKRYSSSTVQKLGSRISITHAGSTQGIMVIDNVLRC